MTKNHPLNLRHCMIVHAYYPLGETRVEREALALIDAGFEVDVLCLRDDGEQMYEQIDNINIYRLPVKRTKKGGLLGQLVEYLLFFTLVFFKLISLHPSRKYKTVQSHNLPDFLVFSALVPKIFGARLILDIHDLMPEFFAATKNRSKNNFLVRLVILQEQLSCRFADHVITVTELWKERLISRGTPREKISVVMNVADDRIFHPGEKISSKKPDTAEFRLIYHGTFKHHYGMEELIRSIAIARRKVPGLHLTLQGLGDYFDDMAQLVDQLEIEEHVQLNGFALPAAELPALLRSAHAGVVPNHNDLFTGELLPTKMMEYVALEIPVIAAKTRVIASYFDENMVQFFQAGDAESLAENIVYLHKNREKLAEIASEARKFIEKYNWSCLSKDYVATIDHLSGRKHSEQIGGNTIKYEGS